MPEFSHFYVLGLLLSCGFVGLLAEIVVTTAIAWALWRRREREYAVMAPVFIGFSLYGLMYDAGHFDISACFRGTAAYWAVSAERVRAPEGA